MINAEVRNKPAETLKAYSRNGKVTLYYSWDKRLLEILEDDHNILYVEGITTYTAYIKKAGWENAYFKAIMNGILK